MQQLSVCAALILLSSSVLLCYKYKKIIDVFEMFPQITLQPRKENRTIVQVQTEHSQLFVLIGHTCRNPILRSETDMYVNVNVWE